MQVLKDGRLGLSLSRKLKKVGCVQVHLRSRHVIVLNSEQEEIDGALQAFLDAERKRQEDDGE